MYELLINKMTFNHITKIVNDVFYNSHIVDFLQDKDSSQASVHKINPGKQEGNFSNR